MNSQAQASEDLRSQKFDLAISLILHSWSALTVAVQNSWGGPNSSSKRDWFAGAVSDFFASSASSFKQQPLSAELEELREDVECFLLQIMEDEFEVRLEDETEVDVARRIVRAWIQCGKGDFGEVDEMFRVWREREERRAARGGGSEAEPVKVQEVEEEGEWSDDGDEENEDGGVDVDVDMDGAPPKLAPVKEKTEPEIDEEGFTKVVGKKRR